MADDIQKLVAAMEPRVRKAFLDAIAEIKNEAQLTVIVAALKAGNIEQAILALNIKAEFFRPLDDALRAAYIEGGALALAGLPVIPDPFPGGAWLSALLDGTHAPKDGSPKKARP